MNYSKFILIAVFSIISCFGNTSAQDKKSNIDLNNRLSIEKSILNKDTKLRSSDKRILNSNKFDFDHRGKKFQDIINTNYSLSNGGSTISSNGWEPIGLDYYPPSYDERSGHGIGRINCMAVHPTDTNIIWIGAAGGGVWKTVDNGKHWIPLTDNFPTLGVTDICVNPQNPNEVFILTGDFDGGGSNRRAFKGIYKSTDGGSTWNILADNTILNYYLMKRLVIDPINPLNMYCCGLSGVWRSTDGGQSWNNMHSEYTYDIEINPKNPNTVYAGVGKYYGYGTTKIIRSYDNGNTWDIVPLTIPETDIINRVDIEVSDADTNFIYFAGVGGSGANSNGLKSFYSSTDAGLTWTEQCRPGDFGYNPLGAWDGNNSDLNGQGSYDLTMLTDPTDKNKVYLGGTNLWMSTNQGKDWEIVSFWVKRFGDNLHADQHYSLYNPVNNKFYFCNDGGIYRTNEVLPGSRQIIEEWMDHETEDVKPGFPGYTFPTKWENITAGLVITEFYRLGLCKNHAGYVVGGAQDNACFYKSDNQWINYVPNYDGMESLIDNDNPNIIYGVWQNGGLCKSNDGGKNVITGLSKTITDIMGDYGDWITPLTIDPQNSDILYMGFTNIYRSTDKGNSWNVIFNKYDHQAESSNPAPFTIIKMSYTSSEKISIYKSSTYAWSSIENDYVLIPGEFWLTNDSGTNWKKVSEPAFDTLEITWIEYDRFNPNTMWAVVNSGNPTLNLFRSDDAGETWFNASKAMPDNRSVTCIVRDLDKSKVGLYLGTSSGIFFTNNDLTAWTPYSDNLPNAYINDMEIQTQTAELYAATYGRGMWKTSIPDFADVKDNSLINSISINPNPNNGVFNLSINNLSENSNLQVSIMNTVGKTVFSENVINESSQLSKNINLNLSSGVYYLIVRMNSKDYVKKFVIVKN